MRQATTIALFLTLAGCEHGNPTVFEDGGVRVTLSWTEHLLFIHNGTQLKLLVFAYDSDATPDNPYPGGSCPPTAGCDALEPGGNTGITFDHIVGNDGSGNIDVYAWAVAAGPAGYYWAQQAHVVVVR